MILYNSHKKSNLELVIQHPAFFPKTSLRGPLWKRGDEAISCSTVWFCL